MNFVNLDIATQPLRMGLSPLAIEDWLAPRKDDERFLTERAWLIAAKPRDVIAITDKASHSVAELVNLLHDHGPLVFDQDSTEATLRSIGKQIAEDICILEKFGDAHRLTAAVLCFPNRWKLRDKIGKTVTEIHAPVPQYEAQISETVERFLAKLRPLRVFVRDNWGLASSPTLHQPNLTSPVSTRNLEHAFLRVEEQSFLKLPETHAIVFAIRTIVTPWMRVPDDTRNTVTHAIQALSPDWLEYKCLVKDGLD